MVAQKGSLVLLKVGNGEVSESFTTLGGLRTTSFVHNNEMVDATNADSGTWRALLTGAGVRGLTISATGVFTDAASEASIRSYALSGQVKNYELTFGNGDKIAGAFHIPSYSREGNYGGEEVYSVSLASAGTVTFTAG